MPCKYDRSRMEKLSRRAKRDASHVLGRAGEGVLGGGASYCIALVLGRYWVRE